MSALAYRRTVPFYLIGATGHLRCLDPHRLHPQPTAPLSLLDPLRRSILRALEDQGSSSSTAESLGQPRQRLNYHVRALEREGLPLHVEDRRKGSCIERIVRARAWQYVIAPAILGGLGFGESRGSDQRFSFSTEDLVASSCRSLNDLAALLETDLEAVSHLPTLSLLGHIRFRSSEEEVEFANAMRNTLNQVSRRYHDPRASDGLTFRINIRGSPRSPAVTPRHSLESTAEPHREPRR